METKPKTLAARMCDVMYEVTALIKQGRNEKFGYRYVREADVAHVVRPLLGQHGIALIPSIESCTSSIEQTSSGNNTVRTHVVVRYTLINADDPQDVLVSLHHGEALDSQDKGIFKALTSIHKYFFLRTFCLGADDEVDADNSTGVKKGGWKNPPAPAQRPAPQTVVPALKPASILDGPRWYDLSLIAEDKRAEAMEYAEANGGALDAETSLYVSPKPLKKLRKAEVPPPSDDDIPDSWKTPGAA